MLPIQSVKIRKTKSRTNTESTPLRIQCCLVLLCSSVREHKLVWFVRHYKVDSGRFVYRAIFDPDTTDHDVRLENVVCCYRDGMISPRGM